jgi:hypothetical protein
MTTGTIAANFDSIWSNYLKRPLTGSFKTHMDDLEKARVKYNSTVPPPVPLMPENTPCVIQLCHGLNKAGIMIPPHSFWRTNAKIDGRYYLSAVNELESYLNQRFFTGTPVDGATPALKQASLKGKRGILTFGGFHCELWKDDQILQRDRIPLPNGGSVDGMSGQIWNAKKIMFWEVKGSTEFAPRTALPAKMLGWWKVVDPIIYYYYFETDNIVFYTKTAPKKATDVPDKTGVNYGKVLLLPTSPFGFRIDWNPADGGATVETFFEVPSGSGPTLRGTSNRYGDLTATKLAK